MKLQMGIVKVEIKIPELVKAIDLLYIIDLTRQILFKSLNSFGV